MNVKVIPDAIVRQFLEPCGISPNVQWQTGGLSGAWIGKVTAKYTGKVYALRRWPEGTELARVLEVHRVRRQLQQRTHLVPVLHSSKDRSSVVTFEGMHWELEDWIQGIPLATPTPRKMILHAASALAEFHAASATLGIVRQPSTVLSQRRERFTEIEKIYPQIIAALAERHPPLFTLLQPTLAELKPRFALHRERLGDLVATVTPCQWILRDVHRAHVLFDVSGEVSGFIDFDAMRIDTPMADLARLLTDLTADQPDTFEPAVEVYCAQRCISAEERVLLRELCDSLPTGAAWTWIEWLALDQLPEGVLYEQAISRIQGFAKSRLHDCLT